MCVVGYGGTMNDIEATKEQARQLLDSRIDSVTELVKARQRVSELETQLTEAKKKDKRAYVRATKDGWSVDELKKLGLDQQATTRRRQTTKKPADNRSAENSDA